MYRDALAEVVQDALGDTPATQVLMTVYRTGEFVMGTEATVHKCGIEGKRRFRFEVWYRGYAPHLDERGFTVDNADLYRYFRDKAAKDSFDSCELICLRALDYFRTAWEGSTYLRVRVWGLEDVTYVEAEWPAPSENLFAQVG
jgi:hypothetical protein